MAWQRLEGSWCLQVFHGVSLEPLLADRKPIEPTDGVHGPGDRAGAESLRSKQCHEGGDVLLAELQRIAALALREREEARQVVAIGDEGAGGQPALHPQVVEVLLLEGPGHGSEEPTGSAPR